MQSDWKPKYNPWAIAATVTLATFMEVLDTTVANVALPHIAGDLAVGQDAATWIISSYLVANAVILPLSGYLALRFGRKRFYMTCVALFGISSFLCGIAPNLPLLLLFRVLQGLGGGGLATSEQAILADTFEPTKRGQAFAFYGLAVVVAPAVGPLFGGWITDHFSWRWTFLFNVPFAVLSLVLTNRLLEDPPYLAAERKRSDGRKGGHDYAGFLLTAITFGALEVVLDKGQEDDWFGSRMITAFAITSALSLIALIARESTLSRKGERPIIALSLFANRTFAASFVLMFSLGVGLYGSTLLVPLYLQSVMGMTATTSGMALSLGGISTVILMPFVGYLVGKVDPRFLLALGFAVTAASFLYMMRINLDITVEHMAWLRFVQSSAVGFLFIPLQTLSYTDVPQEKNSDVSGLINLSRNVGGSVGASMVSTIVARHTQVHQQFLIQGITAGASIYEQKVGSIVKSLLGAGIPPSQARPTAIGIVYRQVTQQAALLSYRDLLETFSVISFLMVPLVFVMKRGRAGGSTTH